MQVIKGIWNNKFWRIIHVQAIQTTKAVYVMPPKLFASQLENQIPEVDGRWDSYALECDDGSSFHPLVRS